MNEDGRPPLGLSCTVCLCHVDISVHSHKPCSARSGCQFIVVCRTDENYLSPPSCTPPGGDSGIGRAVAVHYAREGADVAIVYLDEHKDAEETVALVEKEGRKCLKFAGDVGKPEVGYSVYVWLGWPAMGGF